jgi:hypothetical protein
VVAGIQHGDALIDSARRWALEAGVRANPLWKTAGAGADIAVEAISE